jgi:2-polyprenyl-3-methyl-5-hydroxy-6-metoxy-1,4-benzoquinol methylase
MAHESDGQGLMDADDLYRLDGANRERLIASAPLVWNWSRTACASKTRGGMEEWVKNHGPDTSQAHTCDWYHGTWQFLRLLNMVAVPPWYEFYQRTLSGILREKPEANVLISAAADYGMLCTLHEAATEAGTAPTITICDICNTPLLASQWYAEQNDFTIECICDDLISTSQLADGAFDLIVTDELLTVLKASDKPSIVERWKRLLKPDGVVVTTAMIGSPTTPELREGYAEKARTLLDQNPELFSAAEADRDELLERFEYFAAYHTRHMVTDEDEIWSLFADFNLEFSCIETPGECVNPTSSFQIIATQNGAEGGGNGRL